MEIEVRVPLLLQKLRDLLAHERNVYSRSTALVRMTETKPVLKSICKMIEGLEKGHASPDLAQLRKGDFLNELKEIENVIDTFIGKTELRRRNRFIKIMPPLIYLASLLDQIHLSNKMDKLTTYAKGRLSKEGIGESTTATNLRTTHAKGPLSEEEITEPTNATDLPATESKTVPDLRTTNAKGSLSEEEIVESTTATNLHATYAEGRSSEEEITEITATELHAMESKTVPDLYTTNAKDRLYEEEIMESTTTTNPHTNAKGRTTIEEIMKPGDLDFVGLEDKRDELLEKLFYSKGQESDNVIAVTGNAGSGKTVLTKTIYNAPYVRRAFNHRAWVNVSEVFEARDILPNILRQLRWESKYENLPDNDLELSLKSFLKEKRCLVVVDDVWTPFVMEKFSVVLKCIGGWSRLILTTCNINVACYANQRRNPIMLRSLTDEESWVLFLKNIAEDSLNNPALINLRKEILKICGGSPLEIIILGRLLSKKNEIEWSNVIKQLRNTNLSKSSTMIKDEYQQLSIRGSSSVSEPAVQQLSTTDVSESSSATEPAVQESIFNLSYQDLSLRTQFCFLYLGLFPRAFKISIRRLFHLWLAEGLLIPLPEEKKAPEDLAEECFEQLFSRNLIEGADVRLNGRQKICRVPGGIWDVFNPMVVHRLERFWEIGTGEIHKFEDSSKIRRLVVYAYGKYSSSNSYIKYNSSLDIQNLRCYVSFDSRKRDLPTQEVRMFLKTIVTKRGFGLLIVLDLENVYKPMLSETLGKLLHLKYLGLRWTFLDSLPTSVGNLPYLETLDVKHTSIFALPSSIWKAKNLRHLYLNEIHIDMSVKKPTSQSLTNLQTLWGLSIGNESLEKNCLSKLTGLRKLKLTCISESECEKALSQKKEKEKVCEIATWISQLSNLESLKLRSINAFGEPSTLILETMAALDKLHDLYLLGQLPRAIREYQFPPSLKILTLSASRIKEDPMQILGQLKVLNILGLLRDSYTGKQMTCKGFPELRVLKLWMLNGLEEWIVENGAMPRLRELEIRCCNQLKQPVGLELMTALKEVILTNMPDEFAENVERVMDKTNVERVSWPFAPLKNL